MNFFIVETPFQALYTTHSKGVKNHQKIGPSTAQLNIEQLLQIFI
jgi:hypothetical protein